MIPNQEKWFFKTVHKESKKTCFKKGTSQNSYLSLEWISFMKLLLLQTQNVYFYQFKTQIELVLKRYGSLTKRLKLTF
jgi:hypothetical protein